MQFTVARVMRLRHFRGTTESWILVDEDYRFDYQQVRFLQNPVTILPGDRLTMGRLTNFTISIKKVGTLT